MIAVPVDSQEGIYSHILTFLLDLRTALTQPGKKKKKKDFFFNFMHIHFLRWGFNKWSS